MNRARALGRDFISFREGQEFEGVVAMSLTLVFKSVACACQDNPNIIPGGACEETTYAAPIYACHYLQCDENASKTRRLVAEADSIIVGGLAHRAASYKPKVP